MDSVQREYDELYEQIDFTLFEKPPSIKELIEYAQHLGLYNLKFFLEMQDY